MPKYNEFPTHGEIIGLLYALGFVSNQEGVCNGVTAALTTCVMHGGMEKAHDFLKMIQELLYPPELDGNGFIEKLSKLFSKRNDGPDYVAARSTVMAVEEKVKEQQGTQNLTDREKLIHEMFTLFQRIDMQHGSLNQPGLYDRKMEQYDITEIEQLISETNIVRVCCDPTLKDEEELGVYLSNLEKKLYDLDEETRKQVCINVSALGHSIFLTNQIGEDGGWHWYIYDSNNLQNGKISRNSNEAAEALREKMWSLLNKNGGTMGPEERVPLIFNFIIPDRNCEEFKEALSLNPDKDGITFTSALENDVLEKFEKITWGENKGITLKDLQNTYLGSEWISHFGKIRELSINIYKEIAIKLARLGDLSNMRLLYGALELPSLETILIPFPTTEEDLLKQVRKIYLFEAEDINDRRYSVDAIYDIIDKIFFELDERTKISIYERSIEAVEFPINNMDECKKAFEKIIAELLDNTHGDAHDIERQENLIQKYLKYWTDMLPSCIQESDFPIKNKKNFEDILIDLHLLPSALYSKLKELLSSDNKDEDKLRKILSELEGSEESEELPKRVQRLDQVGIECAIEALKHGKRDIFEFLHKNNCINYDNMRQKVNDVELVQLADMAMRYGLFDQKGGLEILERFDPIRQLIEKGVLELNKDINLNTAGLEEQKKLYGKGMQPMFKIMALAAARSGQIWSLEALYHEMKDNYPDQYPALQDLSLELAIASVDSGKVGVIRTLTKENLPVLDLSSPYENSLLGEVLGKKILEKYKECQGIKPSQEVHEFLRNGPSILQEIIYAAVRQQNVELVVSSLKAYEKICKLSKKNTTSPVVDIKDLMQIIIANDNLDFIKCICKNKKIGADVKREIEEAIEFSERSAQDRRLILDKDPHEALLDRLQECISELENAAPMESDHIVSSMHEEIKHLQKSVDPLLLEEDYSHPLHPLHNFSKNLEQFRCSSLNSL